jgi:hypothetical protein
MHERDKNSGPGVALPIGTVAIVQQQRLRCVGIKDDDGRWKDTSGCILAIERIVETLFLPTLYNKLAPALAANS